MTPLYWKVIGKDIDGNEISFLFDNSDGLLDLEDNRVYYLCTTKTWCSCFRFVAIYKDDTTGYEKYDYSSASYVEDTTLHSVDGYIFRFDDNWQMPILGEDDEHCCEHCHDDNYFVLRNICDESKYIIIDYSNELYVGNNYIVNTGNSNDGIYNIVSSGHTDGYVSSLQNYVAPFYIEPYAHEELSCNNYVFEECNSGNLIVSTVIDFRDSSGIGITPTIGRYWKIKYYDAEGNEYITCAKFLGSNNILANAELVTTEHFPSKSYKECPCVGNDGSHEFISCKDGEHYYFEITIIFPEGIFTPNTQYSLNLGGGYNNYNNCYEYVGISEHEPVDGIIFKAITGKCKDCDTYYEAAIKECTNDEIIGGFYFDGNVLDMINGGTFSFELQGQKYECVNIVNLRQINLEIEKMPCCNIISNSNITFVGKCEDCIVNKLVEEGYGEWVVYPCDGSKPYLFTGNEDLSGYIDRVILFSVDGSEPICGSLTRIEPIQPTEEYISVGVDGVEIEQCFLDCDRCENRNGPEPQPKEDKLGIMPEPLYEVNGSYECGKCYNTCCEEKKDNTNEK